MFQSILQVFDALSNKNYFVYILLSDRTNRYYVGYTANVEIRLERHNAGWSRSTKAGIPWKLVYVESFSCKGDAIERERFIKQQKSRQYIQNLISHS